MERISSLQNPRVKAFVQLSTKSKERRTSNRFVMEGAREIGFALGARYLPEILFVCGEQLSNEASQLLSSLPPSVPVVEVTAGVFAKMAYREHSDGLLAVAATAVHSLKSLELTPNPFVIVLESVEKPGNLGAVLRTADAANVDAVIVCDPLTDLYNPNVIRSGIGCLFTVPTAVSTPEETLIWLRKNRIQVFAAELTASIPHHCADFTGPSAIVMGTEAHGLTPFWLSHADARIKIPMRGKIDSLNVSVSTAIITFEAMRQREVSALLPLS